MTTLVGGAKMHTLIEVQQNGQIGVKGIAQSGTLLRDSRRTLLPKDAAEASYSSRSVRMNSKPSPSDPQRTILEFTVIVSEGSSPLEPAL
jgi:hypothetical protein